MKKYRVTEKHPFLYNCIIEDDNGHVKIVYNNQVEFYNYNLGIDSDDLFVWLYHDFIELLEEKEFTESYLKEQFKKILEIIKKVAEMYPYKQVGNRDSYSDYNQGWDDACGVIEAEITNLLKDENKLG